MIPHLWTMRRQAPYILGITSWRDRIRDLALVTTASLAVLAFAQVAPADGLPALIGPVTAGGRSSEEGIIEAQIDPEWRETVWKINLNCPGQPRCEHTEGRLPADNESYTVSLELTGLKPGVTYSFAIETSSSGGEALWTGEFTVQPIPPGAAPEGQKVKEPYVPPALPWSQQSGDEAAARTVREQREKEQEEQKTKEAAASHAAEEAALKRRQEEGARQAAVRKQEEPKCVVPGLRGDTLAAARRDLAAAHCRLGTVHRTMHNHGTLRVTKQSARVGKRLAVNAHVALWMGARTSAN